MSFWGHRLWHPAVHREFEDKLVFYRAHARPFSAETIKQQLETFTSKNELRNLVAFVTFGHYDLMMRAWVHKNVIHSVEHGIASCLGVDPLETFLVEGEYGAENDKEFQKNEDLRKRLHFHRTIRQVQQGRDIELLKDLVKAGWVFEPRDQGNRIRFYVAIRVAPERAPKPGLGRELFTEIARNTLLKRQIVYEGRGFCSYLIKAEVETNAYFSIEKLTEGFLDNLKNLGASTETYLVARENPLHRGEDLVTDNTLIELRGRAQFIRDLIPEVYDCLTEASDEIIQMLHTHEIGVRALALPHLQLLGEVLWGHLSDQPLQSDMVLHAYFSRIEKYLADNVPKFANLRQLNYKDLLRDAGVKKDPDGQDDGKHITIGNLLHICAHAADKLNETAAIPAGDFARMRNLVAHGAYSASDWNNYVAMLVRELPTVTRVLDWIAATVEVEPPFKKEFPIRLRK